MQTTRQLRTSRIKGNKIDWLSRFIDTATMANGKSLALCFPSYFHDDPVAIRRELKKRNNADHI